ncbi:hypothetical protein C1H46_039051 [Malus baccata]|uniref:Uncharacterized protein n=1 Tax=Malus baccata TaxID=106549 RepID=A0A540KMH0_MALBA|nr:hypothetical protein C1H46_039051 [Malus baccata]
MVTAGFLANFRRSLLEVDLNPRGKNDPFLMAVPYYWGRRSLTKVVSNLGREEWNVVGETKISKF